MSPPKIGHGTLVSANIVLWKGYMIPESDHAVTGRVLQEVD
jgi:hypothetical protein